MKTTKRESAEKITDSMRINYLEKYGGEMSFSNFLGEWIFWNLLTGRRYSKTLRGAIDASMKGDFFLKRET